MITVAFTVSCLRQRYLREAIDSWTRVRGSDRVRFIFCLEPPQHSFPVHEFTAFVRERFPARAMVALSDEPLGCLRNTRRAMELALKHDDEGFGVVAEEDLEVSSDVVEYLEWARDTYRDSAAVAVCSHTRKSEVQDPSAVVRAAWFCPLVWGTWHRQWDEVLAPEWGVLPGSGNAESWDNNLQQYFLREQLPVVFPARSRVVHRGELSVLMGPTLGEYVYGASVSECYQPHYPPQQYHEIPYPPGGTLWV